MADVSGTTSDGYHTFDELYEHRHALFLALCRRIAGQRPDRVWRSTLHYDGTSFTSWFVMGIDRLPGEQITYHLPMYLWDETNFATTLERAPEWDGHTPTDVVVRLKRI